MVGKFSKSLILRPNLKKERYNCVAFLTQAFGNKKDKFNNYKPKIITKFIIGKFSIGSIQRLNLRKVQLEHATLELELVPKITDFPCIIFLTQTFDNKTSIKLMNVL